MVDFPVPATEFAFNYSVFSVMGLTPDIEYQSQGSFGKITSLYQHLVYENVGNYLLQVHTVCRPR